MTTSEIDTMDEIRMIDSGDAPTRFARGWHLIGLERDFRDGKPHQVQAFGGKMVVWEDTQGDLNVIDSYCRHMGGDLSQGTIKGDEIACPFHDWRWGGDGRCKDIPYAKRVPMRARTQTFPTLVRNGALFVWNDPEGGEPEDYIPELEGYGTDEWTDWSWNSYHVKGSNCREIVDNVVDMAHFFYVHYAFPTYFKNIFEGPVATQHMNSKPRGDIDAGTSYDDPDSTLRSEASYYGPSYMIDWLWSHTKHGVIETVLINCHYPVTPTEFVLQYGAIVKKPTGMSDADAEAMAKQFSDGVKIGFEQDVEIWKNKTRIDNPLLSEEDGPVYQLRRWYEQFYVDRADITEDMTARFEFEVDTTKANEYWEREVAENMARMADQDAPAGS